MIYTAFREKAGRKQKKSIKQKGRRRPKNLISRNREVRGVAGREGRTIIHSSIFRGLDKNKHDLKKPKNGLNYPRADWLGEWEARCLGVGAFF